MSVRNKKPREVVYQNVVADPTEAEDGYEAADDLVRRLERRIEPGQSSPELDAARASREEARAALAACVEPLVLRGLAPDEFEELIAQHPPAKDAPEGAEWDVRTFAPALLAACAVDEGLSVEEWEAERASGRWTKAEWNTLFNAALTANVTVRSVTVPKG